MDPERSRSAAALCATKGEPAGGAADRLQAAGSALRAVAIVAVAVLVHVRFDSTAAMMGRGPAERQFLAFASAPSWTDSVARYDFLRPPGYPTLLFAAHQMGLGVRAVNESLLAVSILLFYALSRRSLNRVDPLPQTLLFAVAAFHLSVLGRVFDEALFAPLALTTALLCLRYGERPTLGRALALAAACAAACLVRTIAVVWLVPLAAFVVAARGVVPSARRTLHAAIVVSIPAIATVLLASYVHARTGYWTGMDRSTFAARDVPASFADLAQPAATVGLIVRCYLTDFLSLRQFANWWKPDSWSVTGLDVPLLVLGVGVAIVGLGVSVVTVMRARTRRTAAATLDAWARSTPVLAAAFAATYLAAVVVLWAISNNDPVKDRYMYPSYPFAMLAAAGLYDRAVATGLAPQWRVPVRALFWIVLVVQLVKVGRL